jgi:enolase
MKIQKIIGREVLDSRGNPTVEAEVILENGLHGSGIAPSGASTGTYEALELRDNDPNRYQGKGVTKAVQAVNTELAEALTGLPIDDPQRLDAIMQKTDGTAEKSRLGANSILAVSIACYQAAAAQHHLPLFQFLGGTAARTMPVPMMNILNGGAHAANTVDVQEFMILPVGAQNFGTGLRWCTEVYHTLKKLLHQAGFSTAVGDEGGFAPNLETDAQAIEWILKAIEQAGYRAGSDFVLALDAAASEWKCETGYCLPKSGAHYTTEELIAHWATLCQQYPIVSIEDGLDESDWTGWKQMTQQLGKRVQLVGDDLFVTNQKRLEKGIASGCGNAILIKLNQIGTVSETLAAIQTAHHAGYHAIVSHRSGETEDTTIADLAVGMQTGQIKTGAPCRTERVAKYNRLLRIDHALLGTANYAGMQAF